MKMKRLVRRRSVLSPSPTAMALSYLVLVTWTFVVLFPLYWIVVTSIKLPIHVIQGPLYLPYVDFQPSLHAWRYIFFDLR
ncbi:multiple sugar transport system permease protein, partial [Candidatus Hakubella thermalkaliphila]